MSAEVTPRTAVLIPARRASTRLTDKLLLAESGHPLIVHTCEQAAKAVGQDAVTIATDDSAIATAVAEAGFRAVTTRADHQSGTDRIAEVVAGLEVDIVVNVQGDEPEIEPEHIRLVAELLHRHHWAGMATCATPGDVIDQTDPNAVKVALGADDRALSFTRAPCPWDRDHGGPAERCHRHIGLYAYRRDILLRLAAMPPSPLECIERLEQLRALEAGIGIACAVVDHAAPGIDTRADYEAFLDRRDPTRTRLPRVRPDSEAPAPQEL